MTEKQYQRDKFLTKYHGTITDKVLRKIFNKAWEKTFRLNDTIILLDLMVWCYQLKGE